MKRLYLLLCTLLFVYGGKAAVTFSDENGFNYEILKGTNVRIYRYSGTDKSIIFPTSTIYNGTDYYVTAIKGNGNMYPVILPDNNAVEEVFIPSGISTISSVTSDLKSLKNIIIEDGRNFENVLIPFNVSLYGYTSMQLNNIIVLTACDLSSENLISTAIDQCLLKTGIIKVYFNGNDEGETIQMYLFEKADYNKSRPFGKIRFKYLLNALQKGGKDINSITKIDLSDMPNTSSEYSVYFTFDYENYNPSSELSSGAEVIISKTESYINGAKIKTIPDKVDFTAPASNITSNISYSRTNTRDWNSVCLPFDIKESDFGTGSKIYTVSSATNTEIGLTRVGEAEVIEAGTPCFIYSTDEEWNLNLSDVTISKGVAPKSISIDKNWQLIGSFTNAQIGEGKYKMNSSGSAFGITSNAAATVTAFRCYLNYTGGQAAPERLGVTIDEEATITIVPNDAEPQEVKLYDLMGRPRKEGSQGLFIKSTR